ncbi:hypothetical protein [Parasitella parasitica]|uniref:sn-1-specific diacylglycerol lipase n=1 Tax=Parasitella parasitica TaxID=35722 RepID=A0A0B7NK53_9FUNG|nr:hypothetical protein [Parasitella parasitica]
MRRLSLPDLQKLKQEWDKREAVQATAQLPPGRLQIDLLNVRSDVAVKRPLMRLRMGSQHYFSSRSKHANGNWNEGFMFTISYHNQLFDTIELDLYDKRNKWRTKAKHIGKAKLKIAKLKDREDVFITFLPMYEYHVRRYLPAHIPLPHTFLKSHMPDMSRFKQYRYHYKKTTTTTTTATSSEHEQEDNELYLDVPPVYEPHPSHGKHSMTPFIGSIQVRVRYSFQHPPQSESDTLSPFYFHHSNRSMDTFQSCITSSRKSSQRSSSYSSRSSSTAYSSRNRGGDYYHDAVEPRLVLVDDLQSVATPSTPTPHPQPSSLLPKSESSVDVMFDQNLEKGFHRYINLEQYKVDFPKMDGENKSRKDDVSDTASIKSHNFGDKNFAFRWVNESFEEVAISHPSLDRMIGMVVSPQTRILLRAVVKIFNAFGQGFKITILQLLSSLSLLQNFYADVPRAPLAEKITDLQFLDESYYFLGHAIIAYVGKADLFAGWRGISYLGDYAKYLKDVVKTKSNKEAIVRYLKIPQEDLLGYEYGLRKGAVFQPSYFVSYDQVHEAVVMGIRGTWSLYDCITDLVCEYKPWKNGLVHSGILASAQWFFTRVIPQIYLYIGEQTQNKTRRISSFIITGHSLGAGTAAVLTMMVVDHIEQLRELSNNPEFKVHCYSYAPVASVSHDLSEKYKDHIDSFVCNDDLVGRLSYGTASCAKELIMDSLIAVDGLGGSSKVNNNPATRKECFDIIQARRKEIYHNKEPRYPLLYVPGRVFQFRRGGPKGSTKLPAQDMNLPGTNPAAAAAATSAANRPRASSSSSTTATEKKRRSTPLSFVVNGLSQSEPVLPAAAAAAAASSNTPTPVNQATFTLHRSSSMLSEEVLISKTCLEDHMVVTYLTAFQMARQDCMRQDSFRRNKKEGSSNESIGSLSSSSLSGSLTKQATVAPKSASMSRIKLNMAAMSSFYRSEEDKSASK